LSGNVSVLVGVLKDFDTVKTAEGITPLSDMENRAKWSWLRLQRGRSIDAEIKACLAKMRESNKAAETEDALDQLIGETLLSESPSSWQQRKLQYIVEDDIIKAVATTKHLLIPPEQVLQVADRVCAGRGQALEVNENLAGLVGIRGEHAGIELGFHIFPGDILTRKAISVSSYAKTLVCLNPLTFAGIGNFGRFGLEPKHERVLRIRRITELEPRLDEAITSSWKIIEDLERLIEKSKTTTVDDREAKTILAAFSQAYGIGLRPVKEVVGRLTQEGHTTYGMAQASSWVAKHGESWRKTPEGEHPKARQSMATVGAACLLIDDPPVTAAKARKWLGDQKAKTLEELGLE